jgi:WD40 repeat protein
VWINTPSDAPNAIITVSADGVLFAEVSPLTVSIWNVPERRQIRAYQIQRESHANRVAVFGPSHSLLAISTANQVDIWDVQSSSDLPVYTITTQTDVSSLAITFDDSLLITGEASGTITSWNIARSAFPPTKFLGHSDRITGLTVSSDGRILVSASWMKRQRFGIYRRVKALTRLPVTMTRFFVQFCSDPRA